MRLTRKFSRQHRDRTGRLRPDQGKIRELGQPRGSRRSKRTRPTRTGRAAMIASSARRQACLSARMLLTIAALTLAVPAAAQAPATTAAFDGEYVGVSRESSNPGSARSGRCPNGVPVPPTIWNGVVRSDKGGWQGAVSPPGVLAIQWRFPAAHCRPNDTVHDRQRSWNREPTRCRGDAIAERRPI